MRTITEEKLNVYRNNRDLKSAPDLEFSSRALREKMRFDPCANPKDGLTEEIVTKLARDTVV
jgi:hypothetical protein